MHAIRCPEGTPRATEKSIEAIEQTAPWLAWKGAKITLQINRVRKAFLEGRPSFGVYARLPSPAMMELLAFAGLDFVRIDLTQNDIGLETLRSMTRAAHASGITPFVRVPRVDAETICAVLDVGVLGVIVPEVTGAADVEIAARAAKLPPHGQRRVGLTGLDGFGRITSTEYADWASENVMLAVQVETRSAVEEIDAILAIPGLDMVLGGRCTLASQYGVPGQRDHPRIQEIEASIMEKARRAGKIVSVTYLPMRDPGQTNLVRNSIARGAHSVCLGIDTDVVYAYRRLLKDVAWSPT